MSRCKHKKRIMIGVDQGAVVYVCLDCGSFSRALIHWPLERGGYHIEVVNT